MFEYLVGKDDFHSLHAVHFTCMSVYVYCVKVGV